MDKEYFEIRSQEVQELLGHVPRWIIRWGTIIIFLVLIVLFVFSKLLHYPDIIHAQIQLTTSVPPAEIKANVDGTIKSIFVTDRQQVDKGQIIAVIQSATDYNDVEWLSTFLTDSFSIERFLTNEGFEKKLTLGSIQPAFAGFINTLEEYKSFVDIDYYSRKLKSINSELIKYNQYIVSLKDQQIILNSEYRIVDQQFKRDSNLTVTGVLSITDLEKSEQNKLKKLFELKESAANLNQASIQIANLEQEKLELQMQLEKENLNLYSKLKTKWSELNGAISEWAEKYLIIAPFNGSVSMNKIWSENQYVKTGEIVVTILPHESDRIIGRMLIQPAGVGKIKIKNRVLIQFDNYPYLEFGVVTGKIATISLAPENGAYYAMVAIDSTSLVTNYNRKLNFSQNMQGNAEIITESRSLFDRIFAPLKSSIEIQSMYK